MGTIIYDHSGNFMRFSTNGNNERLRITSGGVVNIGGDYTQTTYQAQITGDLLIQKDQAAYQHPQIELYALNTGAYGGAIKFTGNVAGTKYTQATIRTYGGGNTSDGSLAFFTGANTEKLRITSGGALNIGTGVESGAVENLVELYVGGNDGSHATIRGKYNRTNEYNRSEVRFGVEQNASGLGFLAFATGNNSASERMRITSAGKVAINDITPDTTLTVNGSINVEAGVFGKRFTGLTTVDTGFMVGSTGTWSSAVLEVIVSGNPNHLGSGYYRASSTYLVHIGTGWTGSTLSTIVTPTRIAYTQGGPGNYEVTATFVLYRASTNTEYSSGSARSSADQLRVKIAGTSTASGARCFVKVLATDSWID